MTIHRVHVRADHEQSATAPELLSVRLIEALENIIPNWSTREQKKQCIAQYCLGVPNGFFR
jgi:hypothetical protein